MENMKVMTLAERMAEFEKRHLIIEQELSFLKATIIVNYPKLADMSAVKFIDFLVEGKILITDAIKIPKKTNSDSNKV